jgi:hypothetical protein
MLLPLLSLLLKPFLAIVIILFFLLSNLLISRLGMRKREKMRLHLLKPLLLKSLLLHRQGWCKKTTMMVCCHCHPCHHHQDHHPTVPALL